MAMHSSSEVTITLAESPGGTGRNITPYVDEISGIKKELITQMTMPFGMAYQRNTSTGIDKVADITIKGKWDTVATLGPHVMFGAPASWALDKAPGSVGRVLVIVVATGATFTVTVNLISYEVGPKNGNLTEYTAVVNQLSDGVWS
jgi:hypothetical protein